LDARKTLVWDKLIRLVGVRNQPPRLAMMVVVVVLLLLPDAPPPPPPCRDSSKLKNFCEDLTETSLPEEKKIW